MTLFYIRQRRAYDTRKGSAIYGLLPKIGVSFIKYDFTVKVDT